MADPRYAGTTSWKDAAGRNAHLKDNNPVYRKQFKIPEAHQNFIEATLDEWLKLGVVKRSNSLYNSPLFCVPKKQGQGLRIVQDFCELNNHRQIDKYSSYRSNVPVPARPPSENHRVDLRNSSETFKNNSLSE